MSKKSAAKAVRIAAKIDFDKRVSALIKVRGDWIKKYPRESKLAKITLLTGRSARPIIRQIMKKQASESQYSPPY